MRRSLLLLFLLVPAATPALAQASNPAVEAQRALYEQVKGFLVRSAEQMPESEYGYRPTADVRSFGQLIGHVANAQYAMCAAALGEQSPNRENIEQARTTKDALVQALRASSDYCDRAYQQTDAAAAQPTKLFGQDRTRFGALGLNVAHNFEHYGNLVTYMRMKGMTPPSSQPRS